MERLPILMIDMRDKEKSFYFMSRTGGNAEGQKKVTIELDGRDHTFRFKTNAIMYVVVFQNSRESEVTEITSMKEALDIAKWKFGDDIINHTLYRQPASITRTNNATVSRLRMISV